MKPSNKKYQFIEIVEKQSFKKASINLLILVLGIMVVFIMIAIKSLSLLLLLVPTLILGAMLGANIIFWLCKSEHWLLEMREKEQEKLEKEKTND